MDSSSTVARAESADIAPVFRSKHNEVTGLVSYVKGSTELNINTVLQASQNKTTAFYIGRTYNEALQVKQFGFEIDKLEQRQKNRQLEYGPGLYTTTNKSLAIYFANLNAQENPAHGGSALIKIILEKCMFEQLVCKYTIIIDAPLIILDTGDLMLDNIPSPCIETVFPYISLPELNEKAIIEIEKL